MVCEKLENWNIFHEISAILKSLTVIIISLPPVSNFQSICQMGNYTLSWGGLMICSQESCNSCNMGARDLPDMYARSPRAYISGESRAPMLQVPCITSGTLNICLTYRFCFAYLYNNEYSFWLWFFYLTFQWRLFILCIVVFLYNTVFTWKLALRNRDKWWV